MELQEIANKVCKHLPEGYELILFMEKGAAWFEMYNDKKPIELEDSTDKTLVEQINDALAKANGWIK